MASPLRIYFVLAFSLTWGVGGIALLIGLWMPGSRPLTTSSPLYYLAAYAVSLTGIVLTARYEGREGLRRLGRRLLPWRSPLRWYVIVAAGYAANTAITLGTAALVQTLNVFFAAEGIAAALVVVVGGLRSTRPSAPTTSEPAVVSKGGAASASERA
jgi:hypothetical protein